ncbi:hypothetical protein [Nocardioides sp. L-11A]|uniref:hypothetical protein n=1 Tax=Nocardioides sp. L-11A TaxID=3043848 RepID=UPI002499C040|nr:hypothetical protein QJ852_15900 [Nocardioides sp. L-11A]
MDLLGTRPALLCLTVAVLLGGCAGAGSGEPDLRTPPARDLPLGSVGDLADEGADGPTTP